MRHHTSEIADKVISRPRMAVKPHSTTQKWICHCARAWGVMEDGEMRRRQELGETAAEMVRHQPPGCSLPLRDSGMRNLQCPFQGKSKRIAGTPFRVP